MNEKCGFMRQSAKSVSKKLVREYMSSLSLFQTTFKLNTCGMIKIIPSDKFSSFTILHYYMADSFKEKSYPVYKLHEQFKYNNFPLNEFPTIIKNSTNSICNKKDNSSIINIPDKSLIRFYVSKQIFYVENGLKRLVPSMSILVAHGFDTSDVKVIKNELIFDELPIGPPLT